MAKKVVIVGGGASGLMAAIYAAKNQAKVIVIEHKDRVGKKILMTGNGKCNLTNMSDLHGKYHSDSLPFVYHILESFDAKKVRAFFEEAGLYTKEKRDGGVYPVSEQAAIVLDTLRMECARLVSVNHKKIISYGLYGYKRRYDLLDNIYRHYAAQLGSIGIVG